MMSGLRPIHSVETMTWTSEISGTASSGVCLIAQMPQTVRITVPVNTRNRFDAHQSMMRSIMIRSLSPRRRGPTPGAVARPKGLATAQGCRSTRPSFRGQRQFLLADLFSALLDAHGDSPLAGHRDLTGAGVG